MENKEINGKFKVDKNRIKSQIKIYFQTHNLWVQNKLIQKALIFIDGYVCCLVQMGEFPMREKEIEDVIVEEAISYIENKLIK